MDYRTLTDEQLATQLAAVSKLSYEQALAGIKSENPSLGRDWAIYRLESRAFQEESSERLGQHISNLSRALAV